MGNTEPVGTPSEISYTVASTLDGNVIIDFGQLIRWVKFDPDATLRLGNHLINIATKAKEQQKQG